MYIKNQYIHMCMLWEFMKMDVSGRCDARNWVVCMEFDKCVFYRILLMLITLESVILPGLIKSNFQFICQAAISKRNPLFTSPIGATVW
ncbi:hypothetical protein DMA11_00290 [Marinilabiliaceae bacterium JC017]|nr:hypothetical protein DMA11_00290 [Marinilabiliaceae bacterium JC017]